MKFEQFADLITPVFANDAAEISTIVLRLTFDHLFDQNSNGTVEQEEFESLCILLQGFNTYKKNLLQENLRQMLGNRNKHISFKGIHIQNKYKILNFFFSLEFYDYVKCGSLRNLLMS